jgi:hypothetical protein
MSKRQTCSQEDILSTCKVRTLLELGCRQCKSRRQCIDFKFKHNGLSPYEYNNIKSKEDNENEEK